MKSGAIKLSAMSAMAVSGMAVMLAATSARAAAAATFRGFVRRADAESRNKFLYAF